MRILETTLLRDIASFPREAIASLAPEGVATAGLFAELARAFPQALFKSIGFDTGEASRWQQFFDRALPSRKAIPTDVLRFFRPLLGCEPALADAVRLPHLALPRVETRPNRHSLLRYNSPMRSQYRRGTCVAFAALSAYEARLKTERGESVDHSRHFLYWNCQHHSGNVREGTSISLALKLLQQDGVPTEKACPYQKEPEPGNPGGYTPAKAAFGEAKEHRIAAYHSLASNDLDQIKAAIVDGYVVVVGVPVYRSWANAYTHRYGVVPDRLSPSDDLMGHHAIALMSYDDAANTFGFKNSWTEMDSGGQARGWAVESSISPGYGTISYRYVTTAAHGASVVATRSKRQLLPRRPKPWTRPKIRVAQVALGLPVIASIATLAALWAATSRLDNGTQLAPRQTTAPLSVRSRMRAEGGRDPVTTADQRSELVGGTEDMPSAGRRTAHVDRPPRPRGRPVDSTGVPISFDTNRLRAVAQRLVARAVAPVIEALEVREQRLRQIEVELTSDLRKARHLAAKAYASLKASGLENEPLDGRMCSLATEAKTRIAPLEGQLQVTQRRLALVRGRLLVLRDQQNARGEVRNER